MMRHTLALTSALALCAGAAFPAAPSIPAAQYFQGVDFNPLSDMPVANSYCITQNIGAAATTSYTSPIASNIATGYEVRPTSATALLVMANPSDTTPPVTTQNGNGWPGYNSAKPAEAIPAAAAAGTNYVYVNNPNSFAAQVAVCFKYVQPTPQR